MQENVQTDDMEKRAQYGNAVRTFRLSRELIDALDRECAREGRRYDAPDCPPGTPTPRADLIRRLLWEALASRGAIERRVNVFPTPGEFRKMFDPSPLSQAFRQFAEREARVAGLLEQPKSDSREEPADQAAAPDP